MFIAAIGVTRAQTTGELLRISETNLGISTARSAAMGGAFTSLGADLASMSINPAGLAMYKTGEISISPSWRGSGTKTGYTGMEGSSDRSNKLTINSFGAAYVINDVTIALGYNRLADFYSNSTSYGSNQDISITDMYAEQLYGVNSENIGIPKNDIYRAFYDYPPTMWGSILGYQTGAVGLWNGTNNVYSSLLNQGDLVLPMLIRQTRGAVDEFTLSGAYNYKGILYLGATLGIQSITYAKYDTYIEDGLPGNSGGFGFMESNRNLRMTGAGFNVKVGATVRPVDWFRFGVSYHSPTWTSMHEEYDESMIAAESSDINKPYFSDTPLYVNDYNTHGPSRLLAGLSFTIANRVLISADYQRTWYKSMGFTQNFNEYSYRPEITATFVDNYDALFENMNSRGDIDLNPIIKQNYRTTNTFSAGIEGQIFKGGFLRLGYIYQDSPYSDPELRSYGTLNQFSAGFGYRTGKFSVDLAYINSKTKQIPYKYYYYAAEIDNDLYEYTPQGWANTDYTAQNVILTVGFRF